jgi:hypothetical protein
MSVRFLAERSLVHADAKRRQNAAANRSEYRCLDEAGRTIDRLWAAMACAQSVAGRGAGWTRRQTQTPPIGHGGILSYSICWLIKRSRAMLRHIPLCGSPFLARPQPVARRGGQLVELRILSRANANDFIFERL